MKKDTDSLKAKLATFDISWAALDNLNELKNGHVLALSLSLTGGERSKTTLNSLPEKFKIGLNIDVIERIRKYYRQKSRSLAGKKQLTVILDQPLANLDQPLDPVVPEQLPMPNLASQTEPPVSVAPVESSLGRQSYQNIVYKYTKNRENQFYHLNCRLRKPDCACK